MKLYNLKGSFSKRLYQRLLLELNCQNERDIIQVFTIDHNNHKSGTLVCLCNNKDSIPPSSLLLNEQLDSVYSVNFATNPSDFELPNGYVTMFRGYPWPYQKSFPDIVYDVMSKTYTTKGLIRHRTHHRGNFEMIGKRMSKQSTSNMLMGKSQVDSHQYYRETMNLLLLPHTKRIMNVLMKEAISANNVSEESLMFWYRSQLNVRSEQHICFHSVITQQHFHNTLHTDNNSNLSSES